MSEELVLPAELRIGPHTYRVRLSDKLEEYGHTDNRQSKIRLAGWQADGQLRDTLLHEALHAIVWCSGGSRLLALSDEDEERMVRLISPWLLQLLRDNPDLVRYLLVS